MASGIFIVPLLTLVCKVDIRHAIGASIVSVVACSCAGSPAFLEGRLTNIRLAVVLEVATTLGALTGVLLSGLVPTTALFAIFALILLVSAYQMLLRRKEHFDAAEPTGLSARLGGIYPDGGKEVSYAIHRLPLGLGLMYGAGLISALLGIGSGVLKIPAMDTALRLPLKVSSATSMFMIGVTASASAVAYLIRGEIDLAVAGPVVVGSVVGSWLGARWLIRSAGEKIRILFVCVLIALSLQMLLVALGVIHTA